MKEEWKDILNYEGLYQVSNLGNVRSLDRLIETISKNQYKNFNVKLFHKGKKLKILKNSNGYLYVWLAKNKKKKKYAIHRLVAETFISNPNNLPCVNHKDENKYNNNINNLEFCSYKYNNNYGNRNKKIVSKLNLKIAQYDLQGNFIKEWESIKDATETLKIRNISQVVNGKRKQAGGYIWKKLKV